MGVCQSSQTAPATNDRKLSSTLTASTCMAFPIPSVGGCMNHGRDIAILEEMQLIEYPQNVGWIAMFDATLTTDNKYELIITSKSVDIKESNGYSFNYNEYIFTDKWM